jgi:hypothetical protein
MSVVRCRPPHLLALVVSSLLSATAFAQEAAPPGNPLRNAYFGDLHVHTALSLDAFITNTRTLPDDAYRYAKGEAIEHVSGQRIQIGTPLDFMAVTDHAEVIGVAQAMADPEHPLSASPLAQAFTSTDYETSHNTFRMITAAGAAGPQSDSMIDPQMADRTMRSAWQRIVEAAQAHYEPGRFTTFVAYEWSSMPNLANLHRNVVFRGTDVPERPYSSTDSNRPEDLWAHLDDWRVSGSDAIAIPHNSNASRGLMYPLVDSDGAPLSSLYARTRLRNEPITEITQFKGTSETHPVLSPTDEQADFEIWNTVVGATEVIEPDIGSYVRTAYGRGLAIEDTQGFNPYKFGLIGSSDSHNSSSAVEESNFTGGHGNADMTAEVRLDSRPSTLADSSLSFSASGLAVVWAEANTREAIFDAMRRRETFATSGPRIRVRFFAGEALGRDLWSRNDAVELAYRGGVPMGGELAPTQTSPVFAAWALRDPESTALDRLQIVKGWSENGEPRERIYDIACADGRAPGGDHRCAPSEATVELETCAVDASRGAAELQATWTDPDFEPGQRTFYYVRVLENPSCRWSTWDAVRTGRTPPPEVSTTLKERAWTSPIWVGPES